MDRIKYKRSKLSQSIIPDMKNIPYPDGQHNDRSSLLLLRIVRTLNITTTTTNTINHNHNHNHNIKIKSFLIIENIIMNLLLSLLLMLIFGSIFNQITTRTSVLAMDEFVLDDDVLKKMVGTFGRELSMVGIEQTCLGKIEENFQRYSQEVQWFDGNKMMDDMRNDVMYMFNWKKHSVERIANESERLASNHTYDKNIEIDYLNVKDLDKDGLPLQQNANFDDAFVNMEHSAIHVPVNVYDQSPDVVNDIKWSEHLTQFFRNNLAFDPSLSWQFFGSAKGFLRIYPATKWREPRKLTDKPLIDFYDCRFRPWYIKGAASPKDVVILLDTSGSMTGVRKSIGRSVVEYILNTLTDDDYVAALKFSKEPVPISPCLDTLVQANKKNIDEIKDGLAEVKTNEFVNFTAALVEAFTFLQKFNRSGQGSQCNQAIMLITDGAPGTYEEVFRQFNWPNIPVRVFTYLIGQDANSHVEVYWMACHNRGYYAHVMNRAEVHEQVQKYIPVMSRPIVLSGERVFSWTSIYAPTYELELTPVNWRNKQKYEITNRLRAQARLATASDEELPDLIKQEEDGENEQVMDDNDDVDVDDDDFDQKRKRRKIRSENAENGDDILSIPYRQIPLRDKKPKKISLYTTLSTPVFDTRNYTNITKRILIKNVYQDADIETIRIANLLGVAGVDIPIKEIEKLTPPFKLGVNGYSFMITNNGYLLNHPDLRPTFEGFLKPFYNSVDMSEVEIANNTLGPREMDPVITSIRGNMINRTHGWKKVAVKVHIDDMKRVITRVNHYTHGMIGQTPFSLAIALPEPYGSYRLTSQVDLRMKHREENFTKYFRGNQWRVHPEWAYCDNPHLITGMPQHAFNSPEESILQFLENDLQKQNFRWRTSSIRPKVSETILCDKDLVQSLVLDANLTDIPAERCISNPNYRDEQRIKTFGIVTTFVATRSGLTRFKDYRSDSEIKSLDDLPFYLKYDRAIEEIYYKRSVDFYTTNKDAFVYFVDYDAGEKHERRMAHTHSRNDSNFLITATHALFIGNLKHSTPVAVVGIQFRYETLHEFFLNITNKFNVPCTHLDVDCYLVDNNGFVVMSHHKTSDVGKFFGQIDGDILEKLVEHNIYRRVHLFDYQAICLDPEIVSGPSVNPFIFSIVQQMFQMFCSLITWISIVCLNIIHSGSWSLPEYTMAEKNYVRQDNWIESGQAYGQDSTMSTGDPLNDNITTARPCDKEFDLYEMIDFSIETKSVEIDCNGGGGMKNNPNGNGQSAKCSRNFSAQYIPHTNLLLILSINNPTCNCEKKKLTIEPKEVEYSDEQRCELLKIEKYRQRPNGCYNYHPQEKEIRQCGKAYSLDMVLEKQIFFAMFIIIHTLVNLNHLHIC